MYQRLHNCYTYTISWRLRRRHSMQRQIVPTGVVLQWPDPSFKHCTFILYNLYLIKLLLHGNSKFLSRINYTLVEVLYRKLGFKPSCWIPQKILLCDRHWCFQSHVTIMIDDYDWSVVQSSLYLQLILKFESIMITMNTTDVSFIFFSTVIHQVL